MRILLITPAAVHSRNGNRTTANRWRKIFQSLGHDVIVAQQYRKEHADIMIAIHAWRSSEAIQQFTTTFPSRPLIVVLSGTDVYRFIHSHPETTLQSIHSANRLVGLHSKITRAIPEEFHNKIRIIYQSAASAPCKIQKGNAFKVCVAGHLRAEKDPLQPAYAARTLPKNSKIEIHHYGKAHSYEWAKRARLEEARNLRYQWHGEVSQALLRNKMCNSQLLVLPSIMEGGANIISEALAVNLPVIASRIDGSVGLLGENYPGYFDTGNSQDLRKILINAEKNQAFYQDLTDACNKRRHLFTQEKEISSWKNLLAEICD